MSEAAWLLDVNALIALLSRDHVHSMAMHQWFAENSKLGWATCPLTQNGAVRILSQTGRGTPRQVIESLQGALILHAGQHHFWPDDISLTDESIFHPDLIAGSKLATDAYLLGLAHKHGARLVSFDRNLPWQAIKGGSARLVLSPLLQ
jgi:hypothetical protein